MPEQQNNYMYFYWLTVSLNLWIYCSLYTYCSQTACDVVKNACVACNEFKSQKHVLFRNITQSQILFKSHTYTHTQVRVTRNRVWSAGLTPFNTPEATPSLYEKFFNSFLFLRVSLSFLLALLFLKYCPSREKEDSHPKPVMWEKLLPFSGVFFSFPYISSILLALSSLFSAFLKEDTLQEWGSSWRVFCL